MPGRVYKRGRAWYLDYSTGRYDAEKGVYERIRRRSSGVTRREAEDELHAELHRVSRARSRGAALDNRSPLGLLRDEWLSSKAHRVSARTLQNYRASIGRIVDWCAARGVVSVADLSPALIDDFQRESLGEGLSHRIVNLALEKLRAAIRLGVQRGLVASDPLEAAAFLPPKKKRFRRDLRREEVEALLAEASPVFRPIWFTLVSTGLRPGELVALRPGDIDLDRGVIHVRADAEWSPKTSAGNRTVPVSPALAAVLREELPHSVARGGWVFGTERGRKRSRDLSRVFATQAKAGLLRLRGAPRKKKWSQEERHTYGEALAEVEREMDRLDPYSLRYTYITELIDGGASVKTVQQLAGHKNVQTTLGVYAQCRPERGNEAVSALPWTYPVGDD